MPEWWLLSLLGYRSFIYRQECDVKRYMNSQPDKDEAAGTVLNASLPFLKSDECERVKGQQAARQINLFVSLMWYNSQKFCEMMLQ